MREQACQINDNQLPLKTTTNYNVPVTHLVFAGEGDSIRLHAVPVLYSSSHDAIRFIRTVWAFISCLQIRPVMQGTQGITWIELLLLYEIRSGPVYPQAKGALHYSGIPIKPLLRASKNK